MVRRKATFKDEMQSLLYYAKELEEVNGVRFVQMRMISILEDFISSNHLAASSTAIYIRYITLEKMMIKRQSERRLILKLGKDAPAAKTLGITRLDKPNLYSSFKKAIQLIIQAADAFVENAQKSVPFHTNWFQDTPGPFWIWFKLKTSGKRTISFFSHDVSWHKKSGNENSLPLNCVFDKRYYGCSCRWCEG